MTVEESLEMIKQMPLNELVSNFVLGALVLLIPLLIIGLLVFFLVLRPIQRRREREWEVRREELKSRRWNT